MYIKILILSVSILLFIPITSNAKSCKKYRSCTEVILDYPSGNFGRKDGDKDGIPCENVCHSKKQVKNLLKKISISNKKNK